MLTDNVNTAFPALLQILQRVLCLIKTAGKPDDEDGGIVVDKGEIGERGEVGGCTVCTEGTQETDGTRDDGADEEFVIEDCGPAFCVRVDLDMFLF